MEEPAVSTSPQNNPSLPSCCSYKSKLVCLSAGLIVLVITAVASFILGRASVKSSSLSQTSPTPTAAISTPTPTNDLTADWKTLTDKSGKFSVKYKEGWNEPVSEILLKNMTGSLQGWLTAQDNQEKQDPLCKDCFKVYSEKEITIGNHAAIIREVASHPAGRVLRAYILLSENEVAYINTCCGDPDIPLSKERLEQFDQILSTFKFLD